MRDLDTLRGEIDRVNREMLSLLKERLALCGEVADYKRPTGCRSMCRNGKRKSSTGPPGPPGRNLPPTR